MNICWGTQSNFTDSLCDTCNEISRLERTWAVAWDKMESKNTVFGPYVQRKYNLLKFFTSLILPSFSYFVNFVDKRVIVAKCFLSTVFRCTVSDVILRILIVFQDCHILYTCNTKFLLIFFLWASKLPSFKNLIKFSSKKAFFTLCFCV